MFDNRHVIEQYYEIMHNMNQSHQHDMKMDESLFVSSIINKLSLS